jgi:hypothetical protein
MFLNNTVSWYVYVASVADMCVCMEYYWIDMDQETLKCLERNLSQCHFVHQKSHMDWPVIEPCPPQYDVGD